MISHLVSRSSRTLPRRADRARQAARRRSVFMLERVEDRTLLSNWIGGSSDNWSDADNWDDGVPSATNPAIISGSATVNINVSNAAAKHVTLSNGAKLEGDALSVRGNFSVDETSDFSIDTVTFAGNGTRDVEISNNDAGFTNVVINIPDNGLLTFKGDTNISGDLTFTKLSRIKAGALNLGGNLTSNVASFSGSGTVVFVGDGDQTINADGATGLVPGLAFNKTGGSVAIESDPLRILGGWDVRESNTGEIDLTETTIQFVGQGSRTIDAGGLRFNDVHFGISDQGILTVVGALPIDGNLSIGKSFKGISGGDITVEGDIYTESGTSSMGSGVITLTGNKAQMISSGADGGSLLGLTFAKSGGSVTIASGSNLRLSRGLLVDQPSNIPFTATGSTIQFVGTPTRTIDTGYATLGGVVFDINGQALVTFNKMAVGGDLTFKRLVKMKADSGVITVAGNLSSTVGSAIQGSGDVTLTGSNSTKIYTGSSFGSEGVGHFPAGGVIIKKGDSPWVEASVFTPLKGTLTLQDLGGLRGTFQVGGNVVTSDTTVGGDNDGSPVLVFKGGAAQTLTATKANGAVPGLMFDKSGGSFTLVNTADLGDNDFTLKVNGSWIVTAANGAIPVNVGGASIRMGGGGGQPITIDTRGSAGFNKVDLNPGSSGVLTVPTDGKMVVNDKLSISLISGISGVIEARGDVYTSDASVGNGPGVILFNGEDDQKLSAAETGGQVPGVIIDKTSGTLSFGNDPIGVTGDWTYTKGVVDASGSTIVFQGLSKTVSTVAGVKSMDFENVKLDMGGSQTFTVKDKLTVKGNLTITSVGVSAINAPSGAITVAGDLISKDNSVGGDANITMVGGNDARIEGGDFPNGGIVIKQKGNATVHANVLKPLAGPLVLTKVTPAKALTGTFQVANNVTSEAVSIAGNEDGSPVLVFMGNKKQTLSTGYGQMVPGVKIDKTGGSLDIVSAKGELKVSGGWIVAKNNLASISIPDEVAIRFDKANGGNGDREIDTGDSAGFKNVIFTPGGASTVTITKMVVNGHLTTINVGELSGGPIDVYGNVTTQTVNSGMTGNGAIRFVGSRDQTIMATGNARRLPSVIIAKDAGAEAGALSVAEGSGWINVMGNWDYNSGNVNMAGSTIRFAGAGFDGGNNYIRANGMTFHTIHFIGGKMDILGDGEDGPGILEYTGSVYKPNQVAKGTLKYVGP